MNLRIALITFLLSCLLPSLVSAQSRPDYVLVLHGGAGAMKREAMSPEQETHYKAGLEAALAAGEAILKAGGSSMDAVEASIWVLEDHPLFNAGKGAVFTHAETVELDASFMDGNSGQAGAVAGVQRVKHPISAARKVMEASEHVMMAGPGADAFAEEEGLEMVPNAYFQTPRRLEQVRAKKGKESGETSHHGAPPILKKYGTVGVVALDQSGNLAAGTSTGGMTNKRYGRVGDAPIIGAGTYADNASCAVSCTGHGEYFIRNVVAYDVAAQMTYGGKSVSEAADFIIHEKLPAKGGTGGLIALDRQGNFCMPFNTDGMFRAFVTSEGKKGIFIYQE